MIKIIRGNSQTSTAKDGGILRKIDTTILVNGANYYGRSLLFVIKEKDSESIFAGEVHYIYDGAGLLKGWINGKLTVEKLSELFLTHGILA